MKRIINKGFFSGEDDMSSDNDVIYVEQQGDGVIELSDEEETSDNVELSGEFKLALRNASDIVNSRVREFHRNNEERDDILVEIPNHAWTVPWNVVCSFFDRHSSIRSARNLAKVKRSRIKMAKEKSQKGKSQHQKNLKKDKTGGGEVKLNIKRENLSDDSEVNRILPIVHFDMNSPPEFCEISRSGRVIKKPSRLRDDVTLYNRSVRRKRMPPEDTDETANFPHSNLDNFVESSLDNSTESNLDNSCDRMEHVTDNQLDGSLDDSSNDEDNSVHDRYQWMDDQSSLSNHSLSWESSQNPKGYSERRDSCVRNKKEKLRRYASSLLIDRLKTVIYDTEKYLFHRECNDYFPSKISVLNKALETIQNLTMDVDKLKSTCERMKIVNGELKNYLTARSVNMRNM